MGQLIDSIWHKHLVRYQIYGGKFQRSASAFRNWLTADGAWPHWHRRFYRKKKDRYHLYVSLACPWAHRTLIMRKLERTGTVYFRFRSEPADAGKRLDL